MQTMLSQPFASSCAADLMRRGTTYCTDPRWPIVMQAVRINSYLTRIQYSTATLQFSFPIALQLCDV
jgi:hypothetical protein